MSRNLADLKLECEARGLVVTQTGKREAKSDYETALRDHYWNESNPGEEMPEQIHPMLARNVKDVEPELKEKMLVDGGQFVVQEKINGCRCLMKIRNPAKGRINHLTSRRLSDETYRFNELHDKMPHYRDLELGDEWEDTIIDGEVLAPCHVIDTRIVDGKGQLTVDILQATAATMNCDPEKSVKIQANYGKLVLHVFDCIRFKGKDIRKLPYAIMKDGELDMAKPSRFMYAAQVVEAFVAKMGHLPCEHCDGEHERSEVAPVDLPGVEQENFLDILNG